MTTRTKIFSLVLGISTATQFLYLASPAISQPENPNTKIHKTSTMPEGIHLPMGNVPPLGLHRTEDSGGIFPRTLYPVSTKQLMTEQI